MQIQIGLMMTQWRVDTCSLLHLSKLYSSILLCSAVLDLPICLYTQRDGSTQNKIEMRYAKLRWTLTTAPSLSRWKGIIHFTLLNMCSPIRNLLFYTHDWPWSKFSYCCNTNCTIKTYSYGNTCWTLNKSKNISYTSFICYHVYCFVQWRNIHVFVC
jgi:hypothetical protein